MTATTTERRFNAKTNLNYSIWVELNERGEKILRDYFDTPIARMSQKQPDGRYKFQIWEFMSIFGPYTSIGFNIPFATEVEIEVREKEDVGI